MKIYFKNNFHSETYLLYATPGKCYKSALDADFSDRISTTIRHSSFNYYVS